MKRTAMFSPRQAFWTFVLFMIAQPMLFWLTGVTEQLANPRAVPFIVALLVALGFRSRVAWGLLVVMNAIPLLAIAGVGAGTGTLWGHVAAMVTTGAALEAVLWSPAMREYVGIRRQHSAGSRHPISPMVP